MARNAKLALFLVHGLGPQNPDLHEHFLDCVEQELHYELSRRMGKPAAEKLIREKYIRIRSRWDMLTANSAYSWLIRHMCVNIDWTMFGTTARTKAGQYELAINKTTELAAAAVDDDARFEKAISWLEGSTGLGQEKGWILASARRRQSWNKFQRILKGQHDGYHQLYQQSEDPREPLHSFTHGGADPSEVCRWFEKLEGDDQRRRAAQIAVELRVTAASGMIRSKFPKFASTTGGFLTSKIRPVIIGIIALMLVIAAVSMWAFPALRAPVVEHPALGGIITNFLWPWFRVFSWEMLALIIILGIIDLVLKGRIRNYLLSDIFDKGTRTEALGQAMDLGRDFPWGDVYSFLRSFEAHNIADIFIYEGATYRMKIVDRLLDEMWHQLERADAIGRDSDTDLYAVFAGHSLGSLIQYDMLANISDYSLGGMSPLEEDLSVTRYVRDHLEDIGLPNGTEDRLKVELKDRQSFLTFARNLTSKVEPLAFVTFGCPISVFLFRDPDCINRDNLWMDVCPVNFQPREGAEGLWHARVGVPWRWLNYWHPTDFVSHRLEPFFNSQSVPGKFVEDIWIPGRFAHGIEAHSSYWMSEFVHQGIAKILADCLEKI